MAREMKDSGVAWLGEVPAKWNVTRGKNVLSLLQRAVADDDEVITCFRDGEVTLRNNRRTDGFTVSLKEIGYQGIEPGDLVVHGMDGFAGSIGISDSRGKASPVLIVLDSSQNKRFLMYYLRGLAYREVYLALADGIRVRSCNLSWKKIGNLQILLPPLDEQHRIADYLDEKCAEIDSAIASAEASIGEYEAYRRALVGEAIGKGIDGVPTEKTNVFWIAGAPSHWDMRKVKYCFEVHKDIAGYEGPTVLACTKSGIRPKDLTYGSGQIASDYSGYQLVYEGDFVMNNLDLVGGWVDVSQQEGVTSPDYRVFRARSSRYRNGYYRYVFQYCYMARVFRDVANVAGGAGWGRLQARLFNNFVVPVPPVEEQERIAAFLDAKCAEIADTIAAKQAIIADLKAYKQSLIYEAVTGKWEVWLWFVTCK